jgi:soluble lytic murein transglycosylase-like protein
MPRQFLIRTAICSILATVISPAWAQNSVANIYSFKDENGVVHFSNLPHLDRRYRLVYRIPTSGAMRPNAWSPNGPSSVDIARYVPMIDSAAKAHGMDPKLIHAVIRAESGYNARAISAKGAIGLMQLVPATAQRYGITNLDDPVENIAAGTRYLRDLLKMFNGNVELALAGYNAGENAVIRAGNRIPPYPETMAYVPKVMGLYKTVDLKRFQ